MEEHQLDYIRLMALHKQQLGLLAVAEEIVILVITGDLRLSGVEEAVRLQKLVAEQQAVVLFTLPALAVLVEEQDIQVSLMLEELAEQATHILPAVVVAEGVLVLQAQQEHN
jgi:hypothetical protein